MINPRILRLKRSSKVFFVLILTIALGACNRFTIFDQSRKVAGESWHKDSVLTFTPVITDTSQVMNLGFSLEHSNDYPYSNLWLFIDVEGPNGKIQTDTIEFFLAEPDGQWIGKGNNKSRSVYWLYKHGVKLAFPGTYKFAVQQGMRRDELNGVRAFSLWIEEAEAIPKEKTNE